MSAPVTTPAGLGDRKTILAILAMAIGSFAIGTGEFAIMGFLRVVARDFGVSEPEAGHLISAYALGVVVGAPAISILFAKFPRKPMLIGLMAVFALANVLSAMANDFHALFVLRFISGLPHGAYFGIAALVAASMVDVSHRSRAVGRVMLGLTIATLVGMPTAAWLGQSMGWRPTFGGVGAIGLLCFLMIIRFVRDVPADKAASPLRELSALRHAQVWLTLGIAALGCGGMFAVFSYVEPLLLDVSHVPAAILPLILAMFGVGMTLGNIVGAYMADKALMPTIGGMLVFNIVILATIPLTAPFAPTAAFSILCVGFTVAIGTALQTRLMDVARDGQTLAATLNHAAFNMANALGAVLGGWAIASGWGWASTGIVGAVLAVLGLGLFAISLSLDMRKARGTVAPVEMAAAS